MKCKTIFILGHGRSGTTLLNKVLSAHPDICFISDEFNDLPFFYYNQDLYEKYGKRKFDAMAKDITSHPFIHNSSIDSDANIDATSFEEFIGGIFSRCREQEGKGIVWIKAASNISKNVEMIQEAFGDSYLIHIIRDPRDVFLSLKRVFFSVTSPFYAAKSWNEAIREIQKLGSLDNYYEIMYEKLVSQPEKELRKLCRFLGVPFSRSMLSFYKHVGEVRPIHRFLKRSFVKNNFNKWKNELKGKELEMIYAAAGEKMRELGYTKGIREASISFPRRVKEYISDKIRRRIALIRNGIIWHEKKRYIVKIMIKRRLGL